MTMVHTYDYSLNQSTTFYKKSQNIFKAEAVNHIYSINQRGMHHIHPRYLVRTKDEVVAVVGRGAAGCGKLLLWATGCGCNTCEVQGGAGYEEGDH